MSSNVRQRKLLEYLDECSVASVQQLVNALQCSPATIRRDITELNQLGKLSKIRNGAEKILSPTPLSETESATLYPRISSYFDYHQSNRIAQQAVTLCCPQDTIFIASGNTTFLMSTHLLQSQVNVYTNHVPLFSYLISESYPNLFIVGGQYIKNQQLLVSSHPPLQFQGRYLFIEADGLTHAGITKTALLAYMEERRLTEYMDKIVVLIAPEKVGSLNGIATFTLEEIDIIITGKNADAHLVQTMRDHNIDVILV